MLRSAFSLRSVRKTFLIGHKKPFFYVPGGMEIPTRSEKSSNPRILDNPKKSQSNNDNNRNNKGFYTKNNIKKQGEN